MEIHGGLLIPIFFFPSGAARESKTQCKGSTISYYRVQWDVRADFTSAGNATEDSSAAADTNMSTAGFYDVRAIEGDGVVPSCETVSCTFAVGAEVQTLDVYSGDTNPLASGQYHLSFTTGSAENGDEATAIFNSCIEYDASAGDLETALNLITVSNVLVAREAITDPGPGYRYWVTFVGAAVIGNVRALEITDDCGSWTVSTGATTTQHHLSVKTQVTLLV